MKYKAVFFDFDGTLMDTSEGVVEAGKRAMKASGLDPVFKTSEREFIGPPIRECFTIAFGVTDPVLLDKLRDDYKTFYADGSCLKTTFYPGIVDVLKKIRELGYKTAVTTLKHEDLAKYMLEHFGILSCFDGVFGLNDEGTSTKAGLVLDGCRKLGVKPSEIVLIGDSHFDMEGAEEACCDFIGVDWGFGFTKGQKGMISSPSQILDLI